MLWTICLLSPPSSSSPWQLLTLLLLLRTGHTLLCLCTSHFFGKLDILNNILCKYGYSSPSSQVLLLSAWPFGFLCYCILGTGWGVDSWFGSANSAQSISPAVCTSSNMLLLIYFCICSYLLAWLFRGHSWVMISHLRVKDGTYGPLAS